MAFVLTLEPHQTSWACDFNAEAARVRAALGSVLLNLQHIGSTAVSGIFAKPIIDALAEVTSVAALDELAPQMEALGYEALGEFGIPGRRYFRKDDASGMRTHQIHAFAKGSPELTRHLAFRDYLRAHPDVAQAYSLLKQKLVATCRGDFEAYMDGKDAFIKETERKALEWMHRYPE